MGVGAFCETMTEFLIEVAWATWYIFKQASIFLLFGFLLAGVLAVLVPQKALSKLFGTGKVKSVLWAASIGAPLPLCSCGVVPAALGLRRQGATPGATVAFLIATPETGVDSISLTYALMDPILTVFRPITAVFTAITAGLGINLFGVKMRPQTEASVSVGEIESHSVNLHDVDHSHAHTPGHAHSHDEPHGPEEKDSGIGAALRAPVGTAKRIYHYAFRQLLDDTSYWVVLGIVLSGIIAAALPPSFFEQYLNDEFTSMLVMLLIGIPLYVCASEATPLAAALVMKGLNPGAALVFLLAGPATNIGSLVVLLKFLGARVMAIYLGSIVIITLAAGYALNWVYRAWELDPRATFGKATEIVPEPVKIATALLLIVLLVLSMWRTAVPTEWIWLRDQFARLSGVWLNTARIRFTVLAGALALYIGSGLFIVQPGEVGVKSRFGALVSAELPPGMYYRLPWPFGTHRIIPKEMVQRIELGFRSSTAQDTLPARTVGRGRITAAGWNNPTPDTINVPGTYFQKQTSPEDSFLLTGDGNLINLRSAIQYRVNDAIAFAFNIADPEGLVRGTTLASLRRVVATSSIDAIYTASRRDIERQIAAAVQENLNGARAGIEILSFHLVYVHPPDEIHDAFRDVASAREDKLRTINRANIFAVEGVNQAKGEAAAMIEQALAFREQQIRRAEGEAAGFAVRLDEYKRAPELAKFRLQLEAIEEALPGVQKFVRPGAGELKDFDLWLLQPAGAGQKK